MDAKDAYGQLLVTLRQVGTLDSIGSLLSWDEETQMPPKGADLRADQSGLIARMSHEQFTSPRLDELLSSVEGSDLVADPEGDPAVNVRDTRRLYDRARKVPASLVEELTRTAVLALGAWIDARKRSDYPHFAPWLGRMLDLKRQEVRCVGHSGHMYNALLDVYEPGATVEELRRVFESLRDPLIGLVGRISDSPRKAPAEILNRHYPVDAQNRLARQAAELIGFDFSAGRLDVSAHPFCCGLGPGDCRMTTRYDERDFANAFFGVMHETGHALYDQGLAAEHWSTPRGQAISLGIHESQSRMWENLVGRGRAFWRFFLPKARQAFPVLSDVGEEQWGFAINDVRPSLIRTEADEVTYNLHVLLRFELELPMLTGDLPVDEVPGAWNAKMKQYLGIVPPNDAQGCLQDVHWCHGSVGYFPTYTLGNLYAAQFFEAVGREIGGLDELIGQGEFRPLLDWLRRHIHSQGKRYTAGELVKRVTGRALSAEPLLTHLGRKGTEWYGL